MESILILAFHYKESWCWEIIWWKLGEEKRKICTFAEYNLSANKKIIIIWNG